MTEVPEDTEQDCCALLWSLPLTIIFFTIIVVVIVTVGKGGHSLGVMECAPSFWLPWMAWQKRGECVIMVVGCGVRCWCTQEYDSQQPAMALGEMGLGECGMMVGCGLWYVGGCSW
jgi:hypothetical protein